MLMSMMLAWMELACGIARLHRRGMPLLYTFASLAQARSGPRAPPGKEKKKTYSRNSDGSIPVRPFISSSLSFSSTSVSALDSVTTAPNSTAAVLSDRSNLAASHGPLI